MMLGNMEFFVNLLLSKLHGQLTRTVCHWLCVGQKQRRGDTTFFMYRRPILCTLYGAVDFLNVLKKYIMYL
jgi:hypothetical protein